MAYEDATIKSFFPHLIKATFCVAKKDKKGCYGSTTFRFKVVQVASIFFSNSIWVIMLKEWCVKQKMWTQLLKRGWRLDQIILVHKLKEYLKVVKIIRVQVLGVMENEKTFNNLFFLKHNQLTTHLDLYVCMFIHNFYFFINFHYHKTIVAWWKSTLNIKQIPNFFL